MANVYALQKGDTLSKIAQRFGMSLSELLRLNPQIKTTEKNWDRKLKIGQEIKLSPPEPPPPEKAGGPVKGKFVGRGKQPAVFMPDPVGIELPKTGPIPPTAPSLGSSAFGMQSVLTEPPKASPDFNPTTQTEGPAAALVKKPEWTPGDEGTRRPPPVQVPVAVAADPYDISKPFAQQHQARLAAGAYGGPNSPTQGPSLLEQLAREAFFAEGALAGVAPGAFGGLRGLTGRSVVESVAPKLVNRAKPRVAADLPASSLKPKEPPIPGPTAKQQEKFAKILAKDKRKFVQELNPEDSWLGMVEREIYPYEPKLPTTGRAGTPPVGARERGVEINAPEPMRVDSSKLKTVDDFRDALRSTSDNTVVFDNASDLGFRADRVVVGGRKWGGRVDPDKILDAESTPFLSPQDFLRAITKAMGYGRK